MAEKRDLDYAVTRPSGRINWRGTAPDRYLDGSVLTPHGVVLTYSQGGGRRQRHSMTFVWQGRAYVRARDQFLSARGLVTAADRFAREIVESA